MCLHHVQTIYLLNYQKTCNIMIYIYVVSEILMITKKKGKCVMGELKQIPFIHTLITQHGKYEWMGSRWHSSAPECPRPGCCDIEANRWDKMAARPNTTGGAGSALQEQINNIPLIGFFSGAVFSKLSPGATVTRSQEQRTPPAANKPANRRHGARRVAVTTACCDTAVATQPHSRPDAVKLDL